MNPIYCWINKDLSQIVMIKNNQLFLYQNQAWHEVEVDDSSSLLVVATGLADAWDLAPAARSVAEVLCGAAALD